VSSSTRGWKSASPARRFLIGACGLSLLAAALLASWTGGQTLLAPVGLQVDSYQDIHDAIVGERVYFGVPLQATGGGQIDVLSVQPVGVPSGLRVVGIYGQQPYPFGEESQYVGSDDENSVRSLFPLLRLHPVTEMHLPAAGRPDPGWALVVILEGTSPGHHVIAGVDVTARQGSDMSTIHGASRLGLDVTARKAPISMAHDLRVNEDCPGSEAPALTTWSAAVDRAIHAGGGAAVVTYASTTPSFAWNTADGTRPTQEDVDRGVVPAIYAVLQLRVERVLAGNAPVGPVTGVVLGGSIGHDEVGGCVFNVNNPTTGRQYLFLFGPAPASIPTGLRGPVRDVRDIAVVADGIAKTAYGPVPLGGPAPAGT